MEAGLQRQWTISANTTPDLVGDTSNTALSNAEIVAVFLMSILTVLTFQGNIWITIVILTKPQLRSSVANYFVINLCVVDLMASIFVMPFSMATFVEGPSALDDGVCEMSGFFTTCSMLGAMLSLCVISIERFYSILLPMHHAGHATPALYLLVVSVLWVISLTVAVLPWAGINSYRFRPSKRVCHFQWVGGESDGKTFIVFVFVIAFLIPSVILIAMYAGIFRVARKAARSVYPHPTNLRAALEIPDVSSDLPGRWLADCGPDQLERHEPNQAMRQGNHDEGDNIDVEEEKEEEKEHLQKQQQQQLLQQQQQQSYTHAQQQQPNQEQQQKEIQIHKTISRETEKSSSTSYNTIPNGRKVCIPVSDSIFVINTPSVSVNTRADAHTGGSTSLQEVVEEELPTVPEDSGVQLYGSSVEFSIAPTICKDESQISRKDSSKVTFRSKPRNTRSRNALKKRETPSCICSRVDTRRHVRVNVTACSTTIPATAFDHSSTQTTRCRDSTRPKSCPPTRDTSRILGGSRTKSSHMKAFKTLMIIVLSYLILWGPYFTYQLYQIIHPQTPANSPVELTLNWISLASYAINPGLYGCMNRLIWDELFQMLNAVGRCCCRWWCCCCTSTQERPRMFRSQRRTFDGGSTDDQGQHVDDIGGPARESFYQFLQRTQD